MRLKHIPTILLLSSFLSGCSSAQSSTEPIAKTQSSAFESSYTYERLRKVLLLTFKDNSPIIEYIPSANTVSIIVTTLDDDSITLRTCIKSDPEIAYIWDGVTKERVKLCNDIRSDVSKGGYPDVNIGIEDRAIDDRMILKVFNGAVIYNIAD